MAEPPRPPVAVRIVRPYDTEEAFLESELETVGKTSIILIGAHSRPAGVILRFEVQLANGTTIMRGEGRVLAYKETAFRGQPGLALRFTRLDPKSKGLVDRAAAIRDARLAGDSLRPPVSTAMPPVSAPPAVLPFVSAPPPEVVVTNADPAIVQILASPTPPAPAVGLSIPPEASTLSPEDLLPRQPPVEPFLPEVITAPLAPLAPREPEPAREREHAEPIAAADAPRQQAEEVPSTDAGSAPSLTMSTTAPTSVVPPSDRDSILTRLRERAKGLTPEEQATIVRSQR